MSQSGRIHYTPLSTTFSTSNKLPECMDNSRIGDMESSVGTIGA
jgi:hypothetical protein